MIYEHHSMCLFSTIVDLLQRCFKSWIFLKLDCSFSLIVESKEFFYILDASPYQMHCLQILSSSLCACLPIL